MSGLLRLFLYISVTFTTGLGVGQDYVFLDQRTHGGPVHFSYISRLWALSKPVDVGFWIEAPSSFHYYTFTPLSSNLWSLKGPFEESFPVNWTRNPLTGTYLGVTLDSDVIRSRDGRSWQAVTQGPNLVKSVFCEQYCEQGSCTEWERELCQKLKGNSRELFDALRMRLATVSFAANRFLGVFAPIDNFPSKPILIASSQDGITWRFIASIGEFPSCANPEIASGAGVIVLLCNPHNRGKTPASSGYPSSIFISRNNGQSWEEAPIQKSDAPLNLQGLVFARERFLTIGSDGYAYLSLNGSDWIRVPVLPGLAFSGLKYGNNRFVAVGDEGIVAISEDGLRWRYQQIAARPLLSLAFSGGFFLATEEGGRLHFSRDAMRWDTMTLWKIEGLDWPFELLDLAYGDPGYVSFTEKGDILFSPDGNSWSVVRRAEAPLHKVLWGKNGFVIGGEGRILYSQDGKVWRTVFREYGLKIYSITWGNKGFVGYGAIQKAGRTQHVILTSGDGLSWNLVDVENGGLYVRDPINNSIDLPWSIYLSSDRKRYLAALVTVVDAGRRGRLAVFQSEDGTFWEQVDLDKRCWEPPVDLYFSGQRFLILGWLEVTILSTDNECATIKANISGKLFSSDLGLGNCCPFFNAITGNDFTSRYAILTNTGSLLLSQNLKDWIGVLSGDFNSMVLTPNGKLVLVGKDIAVADWDQLWRSIRQSANY